MIDIVTEQKLTIDDVRELLGTRTKKPGKSTVRNWMASGKLEAIHTPGGYLTTVEAVERMNERIKRERRQATPPATKRVTSQRDKKAQAEWQKRLSQRKKR